MNATSEIDTLLFDLGGVLTDFAAFEELSRLLPGTLDRAAVRQMWIDSELVHLFERGEIGQQEFARRFIDEWEIGSSPELFIRELTSWVHGPYPGALQLLRSLRGRFQIACLSNSNELHTGLHRESLRRYFDGFYFSNEIGLTKPDPRIFSFVVHDLESPPERIAFFDDTEVNVAAARNAGLRAYLVDGLHELELCLDRLGLLVPDNVGKEEQGPDWT